MGRVCSWLGFVGGGAEKGYGKGHLVGKMHHRFVGVVEWIVYRINHLGRIGFE